jgi:hypothetical protein
VFGMYNFISGAKSQHEIIDNSAELLQNLRLQANRHTDLHFPNSLTNSESSEDGISNHTRSANPTITFDNASVQTNLTKAGYTLYKEFPGFELLSTVSNRSPRLYKYFITIFES